MVLDEIQRLPDLLNEVHRLIEARRLRLALTGSSARKLRRRGVNLLAGRALTRFMHPLTVAELGRDFDLRRALQYGCLPFARTEPDPRDYLRSYVTTYLREEVQQEGFARNLAAFARFLEAASFSQGAVLNMAAVARESAVHAKVAFDAGVFQAIRPRGPLDAPEEIRVAALETLFLQQLRALNDYAGLGYTLHYWRTGTGEEVDFVLYGERGLVAFDVKMTQRVRPDDLRGLRRFREDYPQAKAFFVYTGSRRGHDRGIDILPADDALRGLGQLIT